MNILYSIFALAYLLLLPYNKIYAHPGNTASDGCHYCRTNCAKWGEIEGARHCHGGSSTAPAYKPTPVYTPPSCPSNSTYDNSSKKCTCNYGYSPSLDKSYCVTIPANAHAIDSPTDVWKCNSGYEEVNGTCIEIVEEPEYIVVSEPKVTDVEPSMENAQMTAPLVNSTFNEDTTTETPEVSNTFELLKSILTGLYNLLDIF